MYADCNSTVLVWCIRVKDALESDSPLGTADDVKNFGERFLRAGGFKPFYGQDPAENWYCGASL